LDPRDRRSGSMAERLAATDKAIATSEERMDSAARILREARGRLRRIKRMSTYYKSKRGATP